MAIWLLHKGNDEDILLSNVTIAKTAAAITSGTLAYAIYAADNTATDGLGTAVTGGTGSFSFVSVDDWDGVIESSITDLLTEGVPYKVVITLSSSTYNAKWILDAQCVNRKA